MSHPSYPTPGLGVRWRVAYKRAARRLAFVALGMLVFWVLVAWAVTTLIALHADGPVHGTSGNGLRLGIFARPRYVGCEHGTDYATLVRHEAKRPGYFFA